MDSIFVQIVAIIGAIVLAGIAVFQVLLFLGLPLGEYSWGGKHQGVLPQSLRYASLPSAILLLFMGFVLLSHAQVLPEAFALHSTNLLAWIFTVFLGLNTLGNLASKSRKEKVVMTPMSGIAFLSFAVNAISG